MISFLNKCVSVIRNTNLGKKGQPSECQRDCHYRMLWYDRNVLTSKAVIIQQCSVAL